MKNIIQYIIFTSLILGLSTAFAATDEESFFPEEILGDDVVGAAPAGPRLSPAEAYQRTLSVLKHYQVPEHPSSQAEVEIFSNSQTLAGVQGLLPYIDPKNLLSSIFTLTSTHLLGFDDLSSKTQTDFRVSLKQDSFRNRKSRNADPRFPLRGLRVAIDPGHMGQTKWDLMTGKFVRDNQGNYLSEGIMALQTSLLLKQDLEALGAEVKLTRTGAVPATTIPYEAFTTLPYARNEVQESAHQPWFRQLLSVGTGAPLFKAFDQSAQIKKIFSSKSKDTYYTLREDLWARANIINAFKPDITLIVHYDALPPSNDGNGINPNAPNHAKVFVAGSFQPGELATRKTRKQFAKKLLDQQQWDESILLSKHILTQFNQQMGLQLPNSAGRGRFIAPGIFARNLGLTRAVDHSAVAYLECLFYNRSAEFYAFSKKQHTIVIDGTTYHYSDRLKQVVSSLRQGVINYASEL